MDLEATSGEDDNADAALCDEFNTKRNSVATVALKKGPWSEEEDAILKDYVEKHGEGNWNAVQKFSGLSRCGKSCRLRWANHLRPDLKKYPFSPQEQRLIIELHARLGPKWARIAAELPGRTDNEIKNFWNTRAKRLEREGLPLYPPDVRVEIQTESPQGPEPNPFPNGNISSSHGFIDVGYDEVEEFRIPQNPASSPAFLYVSPRNMLQQVPEPSPSYNFSNMFSIFHPHGPVPSYGVNYMPGALDPPGLDASGSFIHMYHTNGLTERVQESSLICTSFHGQSNRDPDMEQHQLQPHELSTLSGFPSITHNTTPCFNPNSDNDMNGDNPLQFTELNFGPMMMELPSIQTSVSDFSFNSALIPPPQADPSMLLPVITHHEVIDPATNVFFNFDAELETYAQLDAPIGPYGPNTSTVPMPLPEYPTAAQISANNSKAHAVHNSGEELISRPTVPGSGSSGSGRDHSYQLDTSAPDDWFDGNDYTMLDEAMAAFISDEDVTLTP